MFVEQVMTPVVSICQPDDSLRQAAQLMWDNDCGCIPVCAGDGYPRVLGVITDRDICMAALFQGKPLADITVVDAISGQELKVCHADDQVGDASQLMREAKVRRLPVVDASGSLLGMISIADLAREAERQHPLPDREITDTQVSDTLAAICTPMSRRWAEPSQPRPDVFGA
jgi:CBS domain-containing protein